MTSIKTTKMMERITAARLVQLGQATPDQQRLAYEWFCERINSEIEAAKRPANRKSELERNLLIARYLQYCEQEAITMTQKQACREIAADYGCGENTVIREFSRWKNETPNDEKIRQINMADGRLLNAISKLVGVGNE
jgi:hypothetical protein